MAYNPNLPAGQAAAASSAPVVLASDQAQDLFITGAASQSTTGNNILLASAGTSAIDTLAGGATSYRSFCVQIIPSGNASNIVINFECSNDNSTWFGVPYQELSTLSASSGVGAAFVTAGSGWNRLCVGRIPARYFRARLASVSAGSVQAFSRFSTSDFTPPAVGYSPQAINAGVYSAVTTAGTNAASIKSFYAAALMELSISNTQSSACYVKLYNKGTSPTVGTDVPLMTIPVAATSTVVQNFGNLGKRFGNGLGIAVTGGIEATDTSNAVAGVQISVTYL